MQYARWYQWEHTREGRILQWLLNEHNQLAAVIKPFEKHEHDDGPTVLISNINLADVWDPHDTQKPKKRKKEK